MIAQRRMWIVLAMVLLMGLIGAGTVRAEGPQQAGDDGSCLACHGNPELTYEFPSGEVKSLYVDQDVFGSGN